MGDTNNYAGPRPPKRRSQDFDHHKKVEEKLARYVRAGLPVEAIVRHTGLSREKVGALVVAYLRQKAADESESDEIVKLRQLASLERIEAECVREASKTKSARPLKWAMQAMADQRKIRGLDAPAKSFAVNVEWKAHALVNPEVQARIMADPEARAALLALEEFAAQQQIPIGPPTPEGGPG